MYDKMVRYVKKTASIILQSKLKLKILKNENYFVEDPQRSIILISLSPHSKNIL